MEANSTVLHLHKKDCFYIYSYYIAQRKTVHTLHVESVSQQFSSYEHHAYVNTSNSITGDYVSVLDSVNKISCVF